MRILVTGGCGFIGSNFVRYQREHHPEDEIVVLDALTYAGNVHNLDGVDGFDLAHGDLCGDFAPVLALGNKTHDVVVHFAAETHVDRSIADPSAFVKTNVLGTANLLNWSMRSGVKRLIHVSSDEVYGDLGSGDPPFTEETPLRPRSPYSASKAASDHLALAWFHTYRFPVVVTRCSNNYGPYQFPEKLIPLMILAALGDRPLPVYGDGMNVRDWLHVEDHCAALDLVLRRGGDGEVYNIGGRSEQPNLEIVRRVLEILGKPESLIRFVADRPGHDRRYAVDPSKIECTLGWAPSHNFNDGLAETVRWYQEHESWWRPLLERVR